MAQQEAPELRRRTEVSRPDPFRRLLSLTKGRQYRTGRIIGKGTYSIVKEAFHITTGERYACKIINKKLIKGREGMVVIERSCFCLENSSF